MAENKTTNDPYSTQKPGESRPVPDKEPTRTPTDTSTIAPGTPKPQPGGPEQPAGSPPSSSTTDKS